MRKILFLVSTALLAGPALASAGVSGSTASSFDRSKSGGNSKIQWMARSLMVGQTTTLFPNVVPGSPYAPSRPGKDGLGFLEINFPGLGTGFCSGSLMPDGRSIITAAHCVSFGDGVPAADGGNVYFYKGAGDPFYDLNYDAANPDFARLQIESIYVAPDYTGDVLDQNDVAIIRLADVAPDWATRYQLAALQDPTGIDFTVAGFGNNGPDGTVGAFGGTFGRLREGDNRFEYRLGDGDFGTFWSDTFGEPFAQIEHSWVSDFDRTGDASVDASCIVATALVGLGASGKFCDLGRGAREVGVAGGDSGGPQFVDGRIVAVTSYGLTFFTPGGDFDDALNSSFGEFSGYAPLWLNRSWIERYVPGAFVPEPDTWAMLIAGFGLVGFAARRRRGAGVVSA
jgi:PEP-CTERM motif/Trypsin